MFEFYLKYGLVVATLAVIVLAPLIVLVEARIIVRLRRDHRMAWEELGCPSTVPVHPRHAWAITRFLWRRDYRSIGDVALAMLCRFANAILVPYVIFLVLGFSWPLVVLAPR